MVLDDPMSYDAEREGGALNGHPLPPLGPASTHFDVLTPRPRRASGGPTHEQRDAKRAARKVERQRRKAGRRGGR